MVESINSYINAFTDTDRFVLFNNPLEHFQVAAANAKSMAT